MKKLSGIILILLLLNGCNINSNKLLSGKYVCSNDYFNNEKIFNEHPEYIPSVSFYSDGKCETMINYMEGICNVPGTYSVKNKKVQIYLNFNNTIFEDEDGNYINEILIFHVIDQNRIAIEEQLYSVNCGDEFVKLY